MLQLQLSYGPAGAIQYVLEHLGNKLAALVRLQRRKAMTLSCVIRDCPLAISFIAGPWSETKEGRSEGED